MRQVAFLALILGACSAGATDADLPTVECALAGAADFAPDCSMETLESGEQRLLILRHPDGSFRRFELGIAGRGIVTADGMEQAEVERSEGMVDISVGADRYRLPVAE